MPRMTFGTQMKSSSMEQWRPTPGSISTISILSLDPLGTRSHWVDVPEIGIRDRCQCVEGVCCKAFSSAFLTYWFPIFVYNAPGSTEGQFYAWGVTSTQYRNLVTIAQAGNLLEFDIQVQAVQQGQGVQLTFTLMPNSRLRSLMSEDVKQKLAQSVEMFYTQEATLCRPMTAQAYNQLLMSVNYDFNSGLPLPKKEATSQLAAGQYNHAIAAPNGYIPPVPAGYPQAPRMQIGSIPAAPTMVIPSAPAASEASVQPTPQVAPAAAPVPAAPTMAAPVPPTPQPAVAVNTVTASPAISPEELKSMLS